LVKKTLDTKAFSRVMRLY